MYETIGLGNKGESARTFAQILSVDKPMYERGMYEGLVYERLGRFTWRATAGSCRIEWIEWLFGCWLGKTRFLIGFGGSSCRTTFFE